MSTGEVARLRKQRELECQALQHLTHFFAVGSHRTVDRRYRNVDRYRDQPAPLVGEDQATDIIVDIYNQAVT